MNGSCACGTIRFTVTGQPRKASACHCTQCRKMSGYAWSSAQVPTSALSITGPVAWFASSDSARRGLCPTCGAFLFWKAHDEDLISFALGAIDGPTGLTLEKHIFTADKGDYYTIADGLEQKP
ncbi:GFA family protein [Aestuariicoccus sp. MJ-SS9]|uniref:GFA family protein n=1 Tax=Aestuariicoccus sp. MJ-SS9 TaxID=3079855 RepID=UPI00290A2D27|nr:GFA family protein [Aestuariicoccus sp. MJ-SS9]MDU8911736.1 GFA family protein [Aestuariicoccus sp. MJ-SS9]